MKTKNILLKFLLSVVIISFLVPFSEPSNVLAQSDKLFNFNDAQKRGVFNIGDSQGELNIVTDDEFQNEILLFNYTIPAKTAIGIWTQQFPDSLNEQTVNTVKVSLKPKANEEIKQISVSLEIKGTKEVQTIPLALKSQWHHSTHLIDWTTIGQLKEIVLVVNPTGSSDPAVGQLYFNFDVINQASPTKSEPNDKAVADQTGYSLSSAAERGIFNIGDSQGNIETNFDNGLGQEVFIFNYMLPVKTVIGVWTKNYPAALNATVANAIHMNIRASEADQLEQIEIKLEIKGNKDIQVVQLRLSPGWNEINERIEWDLIGSLKEIVLVVLPTVDVQPVSGQLTFNLSFIKKEENVQVTNESLVGIQETLSLASAGAKGVFNIGAAQGVLDEIKKADSNLTGLTFGYQVNSDAMIGVWTKDYPDGLNANQVNAVNIGVTPYDESQAKKIAVIVELKGTKNKQIIPVNLETGHSNYRAPIHWKTIGELREVVFVVKPISGQEEQGQLDFFASFDQLTWLERGSGRLILVVLLALILAGLGLYGSRILPRSKQQQNQADQSQLGKFSWKSDLFYGLAILLIVVIAIGIYWLGTAAGSMTSIQVSISFLLMAVGGSIVAQLFKYGITGKNLTPLEIFQNILFTGLLAATSSNQVLLQPPASWTQVLMKSNLTATVAFLVYQGLNAGLLFRTRQHLRFIAGLIVVGIPFLFGWLLILQNPNLLHLIGGHLSLGFLATYTGIIEQLGRFVVVFFFNEFLVNAISLATKGKWIRESKAHLFMLTISAAVVLSPAIANLGSNESIANLPLFLQSIVAILTTVLSQAGLWGEVYLITGITLDGTARVAPSSSGIYNHISTGVRKGMVYSGILIGLLYIIKILLDAQLSQTLMTALPLILGALVGALVFPLIKTIIETFDGSHSFVDRMRHSYRKVVLYCRGAVVGYGFAYMVKAGLFNLDMSDRMLFGLVIGLIASLGVSLGRDIVYGLSKKGRLHSWRLYLIDSTLGGFVGAATAFYLDSSQVPVIIEKFKLYTSSGYAAKDYLTFPLVNKWGRIDLGAYTGGVRLLFTEALAGVINWSVAAWLFAINRAFLEAVFQRQKAPILFLFSREGFVELMKHMIQVLRWGLWMSPIIFTFLRMMDVPTWYNQDGAIRSMVAIYQNMTMETPEFQAWSLNVFIYLLAFDLFRILVWIDHMGLRVATLVNLSFIGMNKLDEKIAKFIGPASAQRYIPEAVKRFTTWAPLLLPFYLPRGEEWDYAWNSAAAIQNASGSQGLIGWIKSWDLAQYSFALVTGLVVCFILSTAIRRMSVKRQQHKIKTFELSNGTYHVAYKDNGETYSALIQQEYDITRRSYDGFDPCGRALFIVDDNQSVDSGKRYWPVVGNYPSQQFVPSKVEKNESEIIITNHQHDIKTRITITVPESDSHVEIWTITLGNESKVPRQLKIVPYLEWVLSRGMDDRFHPQYSRLFPEMHYTDQGNAVLAWHKKTKLLGILAADRAPEGYLTSRMDFIGRAKSLWSPRVLDTLAFEAPLPGEPYPTFDPIGSMQVNVSVAPQSQETIRLLIGVAKDKTQALSIIDRCLSPVLSPATTTKPAKKPLIGHGEILPGTPQPYYEYQDKGNQLMIPTPYTPRPFDHAMSNALGHTVIVTNRGLHTTCNGNSQQNRLTPDGPDTVTRETPGEAIYLYDPELKEWYAPTHHPLNDENAKQQVEFGVNGTAVFKMEKANLATELTVFVPPHDPLGIYLLKIKNNGNQPKKLRVAPYFHIVLEMQPERSGELLINEDKKQQALFFENPRNTFRSGPAFVAMSLPAEKIETSRGRFFGQGRPVAHPYMVEMGDSDKHSTTDQSPVAAFLGTVEIPAQGESMVAVVLGQADTKQQSTQLVANYQSLDRVLTALEQTKSWWVNLMSTVTIKTSDQQFDYLQNWLKYQAVVERLWARRGFYQSSGAFGFRDQLQDTVNLMWMDPALARKQIKLHASQQFIEGDVFHWFFTLTDGRTAFASRSHASDNLLWLVWGVTEYLKATNDESILEEMTTYVTSEIPFMPLPKNKHGWGDLYHRSMRADTIYRHCMKSIDLVLEKRTGRNGLPLIGTGDWNDGLDEIGSQGKGESIWLGLFLVYSLKYMLRIIEKKDGPTRKAYYAKRLKALEAAVEKTWRDDRYLRAIHDDGTEIGVKDSGVWEIDALTAAWAVMADINPERSEIVFNTALDVLERDNLILLGWPALREDTKPYLGRSSTYPEGVRENGMYCHGVQWLIRASRILAERYEHQGEAAKADEYRAITYRLWRKITPLTHVTSEEIEIYGGQPNKQPADILTTFDPGRMIWNGYTGAAGWLFRQAIEGVIGATLNNNEMELPSDFPKNRGDLKVEVLKRDLSKSPFKNE